MSRDLSGDVGINFNADSGWRFRRCLNLSTYTTSQFLLMGTSAEAWNSLILKRSVWATVNAVLVMESNSWLSRAKHWHPLASGLQIHFHYLHLPEPLQGVVQDQLIPHWHGGLDKVFLQCLTSLIFCDFMMNLAFWRKTCYFILLETIIHIPRQRWNMRSSLTLFLVCVLPMHLLKQTVILLVEIQYN